MDRVKDQILEQAMCLLLLSLRKFTRVLGALSQEHMYFLLSHRSH